MSLMFTLQKSLPSWECGLKLKFKTAETAVESVAPFVGVWIEISNSSRFADNLDVAPFVGVWIEIPEYPSGALPVMSLPSWECGLK